MVADIVRDSAFGQLANWLSNGRYCPYADQKPTYEIPERYLLQAGGRRSETRKGHTDPNSGDNRSAEGREMDNAAQTLVGEPDVRSSEDAWPLAERTIATPVGDKLADSRSTTILDLSSAEKGRPEQAAGKVEDEEPAAEAPYRWLVDFEPDDPDRPSNWSSRKRWYCGFLVSVQTLAMYIGSAIYTPAIPGVMAHFNCSRVAATAGLTVFVVAYGIAPIFLSPLQELPSWGRNPVYLAGFAVFLILQIPCILAPNLAVLLVFRFLSSFAGAPCLATGGASMGDLFGHKYLSVAIGAWCMSSSVNLLNLAVLFHLPYPHGTHY